MKDMNRAYFRRNEDSRSRWEFVDAQGEIVGRLATKIAMMLRGKDRADFTPHAPGAYVVVVNAEKVVFTGNKMEEKEYVWYTGWIGGQKRATPSDLMKKDPTRILRAAVHGMLPKESALSRQLHRRLKIYVGGQHPHASHIKGDAGR